MPVLYGVFLYMGVASLNGVQVSWITADHNNGQRPGLADSEDKYDFEALFRELSELTFCQRLGAK